MERAGACIAPAPVVFLLVLYLGVIGVVVVPIVLAVVAMALAAAILATPYLIGSLIRRHRRAFSAKGHRPALPGLLVHSSRGSRPIVRRPR